MASANYFLKPLRFVSLPLVCRSVLKTNNWNIGAEGQLIFGGIVSGGVALLFYNQEGFFILPIIILTGAFGGAVFCTNSCNFKNLF